MAYDKIIVPTDGTRITAKADNSLNVPDRPIIPFIEGDGIGIDVTPPMIEVLDAAVAKAYGGKRSIAWMEIYAGEKAVATYGGDTWMPAETLDAMRKFLVGIKGPLTTPVGGGVRSLNVALRQELDLYVCLRPVRYYTGTPSPIKRPEDTDMVIFRENSEDIYAGIEWAAQSPEARKVIDFLIKEMGVKKIRFPQTSGIGIIDLTELPSGEYTLAQLDKKVAETTGSTSIVSVTAHDPRVASRVDGWAYRAYGVQSRCIGHSIQTPASWRDVIDSV